MESRLIEPTTRIFDRLLKDKETLPPLFKVDDVEHIGLQDHSSSNQDQFPHKPVDAKPQTGIGRRFLELLNSSVSFMGGIAFVIGSFLFYPRYGHRGQFIGSLLFIFGSTCYLMESITNYFMVRIVFYVGRCHP